jgi:antitoxin ParD1/3/4
MPKREISLTEHYNKFVDNLVASGRFKNASEVLLAGLRLLELKTREDEDRLQLLRQMATEGFEELDREEGIVLHGEEELREYIAERGRLAARKKQTQSLGE